MKIYKNIRPRFKMALLLMVIVLIILGGSFWEKQLLTSMNNSLASIYTDRLVPTSELFHLNDLMYSKRMALEKHLAAPTAPPAAVKQELSQYNRQIDSLISAYESTYLVEAETHSIGNFKAKLKQYNALEQQIISAEQPVLPETSSKKQLASIFTGIHQELVFLSNIQVEVGNELLNGSKAINGNAGLLSNLQIALVLIITLAVLQVLIMENHPLIPKNLGNFRLN